MVVSKTRRKKSGNHISYAQSFRSERHYPSQKKKHQRHLFIFEAVPRRAGTRLPSGRTTFPSSILTWRSAYAAAFAALVSKCAKAFARSSLCADRAFASSSAAAASAPTASPPAATIATAIPLPSASITSRYRAAAPQGHSVGSRPSREWRAGDPRPSTGDTRAFPRCCCSSTPTPSSTVIGEPAVAHGVRAGAAPPTALVSTSRSNAEDAEDGDAGVSLAEGGVLSSPPLGENAGDRPLPAPPLLLLLPAPEEPPRELSADPIDDPNHDMVDDEATDAVVAVPVPPVLEASRRAFDASAAFAASCRALAFWALPPPPPPPGREFGRRAIGIDTVLNSSSDAGGGRSCSAAGGAGGGGGGGGGSKALLLMLRRKSRAEARSKDDECFCSRRGGPLEPARSLPAPPTLTARPESSHLLSLLAGDLPRPPAVGLPRAESALGEVGSGGDSPGLSSPGVRLLARSRLVARRWSCQRFSKSTPRKQSRQTVAVDGEHAGRGQEAL